MLNRTLYFIGKYASFALIAVFLGLFIYQAQYYAITFDDVFFLAVVKTKGVLNGTLYFFKDVNGRWFSHLFTLSVFSVLTEHIRYYWIYILFMMLWFVHSLASLLRAYTKRFYATTINTFTVYHIAFFITACMFFFMYQGHFEVWYWMSSISMHLLSLTLTCMGFSLLLHQNKKSILHLILIAACFIGVGGLNEIYAIAVVVMLLGYYLKTKEHLLKVSIAALTLLISFLLNLFSSGISTRLGILPDFNFAQALKNTLHTALLPVLEYNLLPMKLGVIVIFIGFYVYLAKDFFPNVNPTDKKELIRNSIVVSVLILFSFFAACYVLSDIAPYRSQILAFLILLLFSVDVIVKILKK